MNQNKDFVPNSAIKKRKIHAIHCYNHAMV